MKKQFTSLVLIILLLITNYYPAHASGPLLVTTEAKIVRYKAGPFIYRCDLGNLGTLTNSEVTSIVDSLLSSWENVSTAKIDFQRDNPGLLSVDVNGSNFYTYLDPQAPLGYTPVLFDDGGIVNALLGAGSDNRVLGFAGPTFISVDNNGNPIIKEASGLFNGKFINGIKDTSDPELSVDVIKSTIIHEFGHAVGLDHSQINVESLDKQNTPQSIRDEVPLMFPIAVNSLFNIKRDDEAGISLLYPNATTLTGYGEIHGKLLRSDGVTPVLGGNVVLRNLSNPVSEAISCASSYLDYSGSFILYAIPPGKYRLEIEPINPRFTGGSSIGNFAADSNDYSFQNPILKGYYIGPNQLVTTDINQALTIDITTGQVITGVNIVSTSVSSTSTSSSSSSSSSSSGSTSSSTTSSTSSSTSSSTTGGPVGPPAQGCTCSRSGGVTCPGCQAACPASNPHLVCIAGQYPDCCDQALGGNCTAQVYCALGSSNSTGGSVTSTSGGQVGGPAQGCSCSRSTGVTCPSCQAACPASNPYLVCLFGAYPDCCDNPLGGNCLAQVYCGVGSGGSSVGGGSTSSSTSGGTTSSSSSTSGGGVITTTNNTPFCQGTQIGCPVGSPACLGDGIPTCGASFGFTGSLAGPGCTNSSHSIFDYNQAFCRSQIAAFSAEKGAFKKAACNKSDICPFSRERFNSCREDREKCECVCPFKLHREKHTPTCNKYDEVICPKGLISECSNSENLPGCDDGKLYCKDIHTNIIDLLDIVKCE